MKARYNSGPFLLVAIKPFELMLFKAMIKKQ